MNSTNSKTSDHYGLLMYLSYKNNKFKVSGPTWKEKFE